MRTIVLSACLCLAAGLAPATPAPAATAAPPSAPVAPAIEGVVGENVSEAELLLRIRQAITEDLERANLLRIRARYLDREFDATTGAFDTLDAALQAATAPAGGAATADAAGAPPESASAATRPATGAAAAPAAATIDAPPPAAPAAATADESLDAHWRRARDLLDVLLQRRQSIEQQLTLLDSKRRTYGVAAEFVVSGQVAPEPATGAAADADGTGGVADDATVAEPALAVNAAPAQPGAGPLAAALPETAPAPTTVGAATSTPPQPAVYDSRVARAGRELERALAAMRAAEHNVRITEELISLNQDERTLVHAGVLLADRHAALLAAGVQALQPPTPTAAGAGSIDPAIVDARAADLQARAARARQAVERDEERIRVLDARLLALKALRDTVQGGLLAREASYELARRQLSFLQSPLAPHRILNWIVQALPRVLVLLAIFAVVWLIGRWLARRVVEAAVTRIRRSANEERVQRVQTLRRALRSVLTAVLALAVALIVLPEFGIDATVLLGSAAVFSLALAFGAQSLIKDYFSGFMILSENQYRIGNVVRINELSGVVEDISMRMTMLRDVEGIAHFVPHSEIRIVSNMSHGWAQALVDVRVGYREDIDMVMRELKEVASALQHDATYGPLILAAPEVWGVEALSESAVVLRLVVRTRPLKQWEVKRELLRRIKNRLDTLGVAMPVPQMTVQPAAVARNAPAGRN